MSERMEEQVEIGDIVKLKRAHACGANAWKVTRTGADVALRCENCQRSVRLSRQVFEQRYVATVQKALSHPHELLRIAFLDEDGARLAPLAAALAREVFKDNIDIIWAGLAPVDRIDPAVVDYLDARYHIALDAAAPVYGPDYLAKQEIDILVDLCNRSIASVTGRYKDRWRIDDPHDFGMDAYDAAAKSMEDHLINLTLLIARLRPREPR